MIFRLTPMEDALREVLPRDIEGLAVATLTPLGPGEGEGLESATVMLLATGDRSTVPWDNAEILRWVLQRGPGVRGFLVAHNHPSGVPLPSEQDLQLGRQLLQASRACGLRLLDCLIVTDNHCASFMEDLETNMEPKHQRLIERRTLTVRDGGPDASPPGVTLTGDRLPLREVGDLRLQEVVVLTPAELREIVESER